ncbi:hypothetical protein BV898_11637 [Hypsibius exemplaris]|uniref:Uncharacterized protein n=1 Tax=Hypsibius exemplaris TaxID=2072580 RepID=A0A1W0WG38_HYPEX|nr:hypothetical protein BV898_11637 [Hypsibius exemplaris]
MLLTCAFLLLISVAATMASRDPSHGSQNSLPTEYKFAPQNVTHNSTTAAQLKDLLSFFSKNASASSSSSVFSALQLLGSNSSRQIDPALARNALSMMLRMGNGSLNATVIADALNRTGRGYGGGGYGGGGSYGGCCGGFDPALWLLLRDDHGWERPREKDNTMENLGPLALLTLLGLALISRMPTQG